MPPPPGTPARSRRVPNRSPRGVAALVGAALLALAAGCSSSPTVATSQSPSAAARPSTPAVIAVTSPTPGQVVTGPTLHVVLTLTGATLVPPGTTTGVDPTQGHIHLSLDGQIVSMTNGTTQDLPVTPGQHILQAEFVASDHRPFFPRDLQTIHFTDQ